MILLRFYLSHLIGVPGIPTKSYGFQGRDRTAPPFQRHLSPTQLDGESCEFLGIPMNYLELLSIHNNY